MGLVSVRDVLWRKRRRGSNPDPVKPGTDRRRRAGTRRKGRTRKAGRREWPDGGRRLVSTSSLSSLQAVKVGRQMGHPLAVGLANTYPGSLAKATPRDRLDKDGRIRREGARATEAEQGLEPSVWRKLVRRGPRSLSRLLLFLWIWVLSCRCGRCFLGLPNC